ncbi:helix-turn-helix domain-containing protein [Pantoea sp. Tr-811]|uniref:helix-turn-helix domain-containing protein n=1 Tax=Pantoea sp. Tr-811 TaxID=2608361 RepID=UPI001421B4BE|nr:helix-turn-helix transcriptional regulator [Pantoea sp. Tr-811]
MANLATGMGTTFQSIFGTVVAELRASREPAATQSDIAQHMGLAISTWSRIERGESALTLEQMVRVSTFLGIPLSEILRTCEEILGKLHEQGITVALNRDTLTEAEGVVSLNNSQLLALLPLLGVLGPVGGLVGMAGLGIAAGYRALKDKSRS